MAFVVFLHLLLSLVHFKHKPFSSCKVHVQLQLQPWLWRCMFWWVTHVFCLFLLSRWRQQFLQMFVPFYQTMWHHIHYQEIHKTPFYCFSNIMCFTHALASMASCMFWVFQPYGIYCSGYMTVFWDTQWSIWSRHCTTSWKVAGPIPDGVFGILHWLDPSS